MEKLGIDPEEINDVFILHLHFDHTGGLSAFLDQNNDVKVWVPHSFVQPIALSTSRKFGLPIRKNILKEGQEG